VAFYLTAIQPGAQRRRAHNCAADLEKCAPVYRQIVTSAAQPNSAGK